MSRTVHITRIRPATRGSMHAVLRHVVTLDDDREYITSPHTIASGLTVGARGIPGIDYRGHLREFRPR